MLGGMHANYVWERGLIKSQGRWNGKREEKFGKGSNQWMAEVASANLNRIVLSKSLILVDIFFWHITIRSILRIETK